MSGAAGSAGHRPAAPDDQQPGSSAAGGASIMPASESAASPALFKSDEFRLYCFKVLPCSKRFVHDWTVCPFAHPGEKAKRRDPRTHAYDCEMCAAVAKGETCELGAACPHSHHVFESWLHPQKYRTLLCKDAARCHREVCFFAHGTEQLRTPDRSGAPDASGRAGQPGCGAAASKRSRQGRSQQQQLSHSCPLPQISAGASPAAAPDVAAGRAAGQGASPQQLQQQGDEGWASLAAAQAATQGNPQLCGLLNALVRQVQSSQLEASESRAAAAAAQQQLQAIGAALGSSLPGGAEAGGCGFAPGLAAAAAAADAARLFNGGSPHTHQQQQQGWPHASRLLASQMHAALDADRRYSLDEGLLRGNSNGSCSSSQLLRAHAAAAAGAASNRSSMSSMTSSHFGWTPGSLVASQSAEAALLQQAHAAASRCSSFEVDMLPSGAWGAGGGATNGGIHLAAAAGRSMFAAGGAEQQQQPFLAALPECAMMPQPCGGSAGDCFLPLPSAASGWPFGGGGCVPAAGGQAGGYHAAQMQQLLGAGQQQGLFAGSGANLGGGFAGNNGNSADACSGLNTQQWLGQAATAAAAAAGGANANSSAPQLQSDYLLRLQAMQQDSAAAAGANLANNSSAVNNSPEWDRMVYSQSAMAAMGAYSSAAGGGADARAAAGAAGSAASDACMMLLDTTSGSASGSASGSHAGDSDGIVLPPACEHLARNPVGGTGQLGWL